MTKFTNLKKMALMFLLATGSAASAQNLFSESFTSSLGGMTPQNGYNANWVWTNSCNASPLTGHSGLGSALFQGSGCQYGNGSNTVSGDMTTPALTVGPLGAVLSFKYYIQNECSQSGQGTTCYYDVLNVMVSNNGGASYNTIMSSQTNMVNQISWQAVTYTLSPNQTVNIMFDFNSLDGAVNNFDGIYVDDISVDNIQACTGAPAQNTITATAFSVCPGIGNVTLGTLLPYTQAGLTFSWQAATQSNVGPFNYITAANLGSYTTPTLVSQVWYRAVITCTNSNLSTTLSAVNVSVAPSTTNTVPYYENFDSPASNIDALPNCSWNRSSTSFCNTGATVQYGQQPNSGNGFAYFGTGNNGSTNPYYFYSNGIWLNAGVTYSASVWFITVGYGFTDFGLYYGPSQSTTGLIQLGTTSYPGNTTYKSMSNTFQVTTSGLYYMAVKATDDYGYNFLSFDDLSVIAPCTFTNNAVNFTLNAPTAICAGQSANLSANGANTYSWSNGSTANNISVAPLNNTNYSVVGTNTLSNCNLMLSAPITVNPLPAVQIYAPKTAVCDGESVTLFASGSATSYTWSGGANMNMALNTITPNTTTTYSLLGSNIYGCVAYASQIINVNSLPDITVTGNTNICKGEPANLQANGGDTYLWTANTLYLQAPSVSPMPTENTTYTVTGTDENGCEGTTMVTVIVNACTGIATINGNITGLQVYPNPNNGEFTVELVNGKTKTIEVVDVTGRTVMTASNSNDQIRVNINQLANGVYYVKVRSENATEVLKVVKQ